MTYLNPLALILKGMTKVELEMMHSSPFLLAILQLEWLLLVDLMQCVRGRLEQCELL